MSNEKIKYPSINGLRAISIILVVIYHSTMQEPYLIEGLEKHRWLRPLLFFLRDGHMGVNVFFVISGFLITTLMLNEEKQTKTVSLKNFYIRRTLRIFPAYYFLLFVYFFLQIGGIIHLRATSWISAITYTKYFNWRNDWPTAHAWSLSIEEHFYLFWPVIFIYGIKFRKAFPFFLMLIVPLFRIYMYFNPTGRINDLTIFVRIDAIATGCLVALYKDAIIEKVGPYWNKLFYISACCLFLLRYFPEIADKIHIGFIFIPLGLTHGTIANLLIAAIMMYSVFGPQTIWHKFLNLKIMNFIGILSYSIYLWQQIFLNRISYYTQGAGFCGNGSDWFGKYPQNLLLLFTMALFSYYLIEKPFLRLKTRFSLFVFKR